MTEAANALRQQQTRLTRDLIMDALADLILEHGVQEFSVQQVADQAGVSHRTVYRHYPNRQALLDELGQWLTDKFEEALGDSEDTLYSDIPHSVTTSFAMMDRFARHVQAYVVLSMGTRSRAARRSHRSDRMRKAVEDGPARNLSRDEARAVAALVRTMVSSNSWYLMTGEGGLDGRSAGNVVGWALRTLFSELERGGGPPPTQGVGQ